MQTADFLMHIDETLGQDELEAIESEVRHGTGVLSAGHPVDRPHLIQVCYDPDVTRMSSIVQSIRQRGLHVQAVGM